MMSKLTPEEVKELEALEKGFAEEAEASKLAAKRQHLEALRLRKTLAAKHGVHGQAFAILETSIGVNVAIRAPADLELEALGEKPEDRGAIEEFVRSVILEPDQTQAAALVAKHPGLVSAVVKRALALVNVLREEEGKG